MEKKAEHKANVWVTLIGLLLFLVGIFGSVRTVINLTVFDKYPTNGVISLTFFPSYPGPREEDCLMMSNYPLYPSVDGVKLSESEKKEMKKQQNDQQKSCLSGVIATREQTKVNDISASLLSLFLGGAILSLRKKLFS